MAVAEDATSVTTEEVKSSRLLTGVSNNLLDESQVLPVFHELLFCGD